ncbi:MAG: NAD(P)/FAD-dependent oxidoreductase, partial [Phycisphaeraceae bacterium]|nr:NAD(P)/FAD-dependent oxidoreductase [Phycisphaeraceae bacterium]
MTHYQYLIIGGGMSAASAIEGIRSLDENSRIGLVSEESVSPYDRPPLSKGLWQDQSPREIQRPSSRHIESGIVGPAIKD